jgi:hypothetical protein
MGRSMASAAFAAAAALVSFAPAANAVPYTFNAAAGDITASGILDVVGGQAIDGTGTVSWTSAGGGSDSLTLLTLSNPLAQPCCGAVPAGQLNGVFTGGNFNGDTVFPVDGLGLVFIVGTPGAGSSSTGIHAGGFNIWYNGGTSYTLYLSSPYDGQTGTATFTECTDCAPSPSATPLPAALPLFATGLGALGFLGFRRKRKAARLVA